MLQFKTYPQPRKKREKKSPSDTSSPPPPTHTLPLQHMRRRPPSPNILLQLQPPHLRIPRLAIHQQPQDPLDVRICRHPPVRQFSQGGKGGERRGKGALSK